jgi:hypothetical protein
LTLNHYILRQSGGRTGGFEMHWAGRRTSAFQPDEFYNWGEVEWAVERRLLMAGLYLKCMAFGWPCDWRRWQREVDVFCEVGRAYDRRLKRKRRGWVRAGLGGTTKESLL